MVQKGRTMGGATPGTTCATEVTVRAGAEDIDAQLSAPDGGEMVDPVMVDSFEAVLDAEDLDVVAPQVGDRGSMALDDYDFDALVAGMTASDVAGNLEALEALKPGYIAAARAAGKRNPGAEYYNVANIPLFRRRKAVQARIAALEEMDTLTDDDEWELHRAHSELEAMTELLVRFNYGMTRAYVRKFTSNTSADDSADFQGAANVGLMYAIQTFDPDKGRFGSWSFKPIQRAVLKAVRDADFANMTPGDFERRPLITKAKDRLSAGLEDGATLSHEQIATEAGVTVELVNRVLAAPHLDSIHTMIGDDGGTELGDLIPDTAPAVEDSAIASLEISTLLRYGLPMLEPRERYVLVCRYGLHGEPPEALSDIGKHLNLSREAVRQIAGKALGRLLHPSVAGVLARGGRP